MQAHSAYGAIAITRARELPARVALGSFIGVAVWAFTGHAVALLWFVVMVAAQFAERLATAPIRRAPEVDPPKAAQLMFAGWVTLNAVIYSSIAAFTWFNSGLNGKVFAILTPAGALLNIALAMDRAPRVMTVGWAPHILYLVGLPLSYSFLSPERDFVECAFMAGGALLFVLHLMLAVRRIHQSAGSLRGARDVAEQERARAEEASAAKSIFLATMSHEIRTPMNAVVAAGDLLRRTELTEEQAEHVQMLAHSSELLMGVLNDVLDLSKIESGKLAVDRQEMALVAKLESAVRLWRPKADLKGVALTFDPGDLPERMIADPLRLQQVIFNLLSNAVKFTDNGVIRVSGGIDRRPEADVIWIEVADTGCGMTAEMSRRVFASFEQGSTGVTRTHGGTGLGLTISRRLAELMGGSLTVDSQMGSGSVFRLETPLVEAAPAVRQDGQPAAPSQTEAAVLPLDLLLAEDHEINQRIVRLILEPLGCRITVAQNGHEAALIAQARPFDVILMDMQMPVMGGIEATTCIRLSGGLNATTPILALSANVMDEHRAQWAAVGVDVLLTKPIDMALLISSIQAAAARAAAADERAA